ncbi:unnamed protein product [Heterobilharzia americana]|nr:unnamed protein product [Heterobilharzia americana]
MTGTCITAHEKFVKLRKRLDQLGYKQPLGLDSLPLVERLFCDLIWTTESLRKIQSELSSQTKIRSTVEDYIAPYKADNGRLIRENNELHHNLMIIRQNYEEKIQGLKGECRRLENDNEDMKYFNSQCLHKIEIYEQKTKRMVEQILYLQEKNFQAVVYTPDGSKKQLPFRRQRMDIDSLAPPSTEAKRINDTKNYCCSIAQIWAKNSGKDIPKTCNLLEIATRRCEELEKQIHNLEEEIQLNEKKVENFRQQILLRDSEIERLRNILEIGRSLDNLMNVSNEKQSDQLINQLQIHVDLLQCRNAELEAYNIELVNRQIHNKQSIMNLVNKECQTSPCQNSIQLDNSCQINSIDELSCVNYQISMKLFKKEICDLIEKFENNRQCLTQSSQSIITKSCDFTHELSKCILSSSSHSKQSTCDGNEIRKSMEKHLNTIKVEWNYFYSQLELLTDNLRCLSGYFHKNGFVTGENKVSLDELKDTTEHINTMKHFYEPQLRRSRSAEVHKDEKWDCKHSLNDEMKFLRQERDDLASLLNHFEQQLYDIQGNVRVLTHERDMLTQVLSKTKLDLSEAKKCFLGEFNQQAKSMHNSTLFTNHSQLFLLNWNKKLEAEHTQTVQSLHLITTERDSLCEQLHTVTSQYVNDKAYYLQCLDNSKQELDTVKQREHSLEQRVTELTKLFVDTESERDKLIEKVNCLEKHHHSTTDEIINMERKLQIVQNQLEKVQKDYEKSCTECTELHNTLRQLDQEKDHIQMCLDERTERCITLERQLLACDRQIKDLKNNINASEKRIVRLIESVNERETENHQLLERLSKSECDLKSTSENQDLLTREIEKAKAEIDKLVNETQRLQTEIDSSHEKQSELMRCIEDSDKELKNLRDVCTCKEKERIELLQEYRTVTLQLNEKTTLINRLDNQLNDLTQLYSVQDKELSDLREESHQLKKECCDYAQVVHSLEVQCSLLKRTSSDSEERIKRLQLDNEEMRQDLTNTRSLCDRLERQGNSFQQQYTISNLEVNQLRAKLYEAERELTDLRKQVDHEHEAMRSFEFVLGSSREAEHAAQLELKEYRNEVSTLRELLSTKEVKLLESNNEMKKLNKQLLSLQKQLNIYSSTDTLYKSSNRCSPQKSSKSFCTNILVISENNFDSNIDSLPSPTSSVELPIDYSIIEPVSSPIPCST